MLGSFSEAEDVVQDAWFRWEKVDGGIDAPAAYLTRIVTRLCLDRLKSARARRETYIGPWLPDPLMGSSDPDERSEEHTSELQSLMRHSYAVFCLKQKKAHKYNAKNLQT